MWTIHAQFPFGDSRTREIDLTAACSNVLRPRRQNAHSVTTAAPRTTKKFTAPKSPNR